MDIEDDYFYGKKWFKQTIEECFMSSPDFVQHILKNIHNFLDLLDELASDSYFRFKRVNDFYSGLRLTESGEFTNYKSIEQISKELEENGYYSSIEQSDMDIILNINCNNNEEDELYIKLFTYLFIIILNDICQDFFEDHIPSSEEVFLIKLEQCEPYNWFFFGKR